MMDHTADANLIERRSDSTILDSPGVKRALNELTRAKLLAINAERDVWEFAVEIQDLISHGVSHTEIRWLICKGLVMHSYEARVSTRPEVLDKHLERLVFKENSSFVLSQSADTSLGCLADSDSHSVQVSNAKSELPYDKNPQFRESPSSTWKQKPIWDPEVGELRLGNSVVKRFKWPAVNQKSILFAFEEDGWPPKIDDPLAPISGIDPKRRLSDTIKGLNSKQQNKLVRFRGDGTGEGIIWEFVANQ